MSYDYGNVWLNEVYRPNQQIIVRNIQFDENNIKKKDNMKKLYKNNIKSQIIIFILLIIIIFILIKK
jgi:flagellar biosynthesis/type III secretory pathway M-ring protein FliF/YscJ